jgi:hypothetical protein
MDSNPHRPHRLKHAIALAVCVVQCGCTTIAPIQPLEASMTMQVGTKVSIKELGGLPRTGCIGPAGEDATHLVFRQDCGSQEERIPWKRVEHVGRVEVDVLKTALLIGASLALIGAAQSAAGVSKLLAVAP